ncbi:hypothetical protein DIC82_11805 [Clostridium beijerinckii]|nr:hypothetical protein DIC82_11805 [Clostridium beijerinckii]
MKQLLFHSVNEVYAYTQDANILKTMGIILFAPVEMVIELSKNVSPNTILCSTSGEYTCNGYKDGVITGFEYDKGESKVVEIEYPAIKSIDMLKGAYDKVKNNKNAFMLLLCDGLSGTEESILSTFYFIPPDFKIIGGSSGDNLNFKETYIYIGGKRVANVSVFFNSKRRTCILKENIYTSIGQTLLVTEADVLNRTVKSFNNRPASTEYARVLGITEKELPSFFMNHPLGKKYENDIFIASPMKVNSDKSITFYCELMENTFVDVLKAEDPIEVLKQTIKSAQFNPSFIFSVHCILRSLKFIQEKKWPVFDKEMIKFCNNITGFVSYGEQYYKNHSNQTMVLLLIE